jgi:S1-C subfamily serine protease
MSRSADNRKSVEKIRLRAQELARSEEHTSEAELLAAIFDGTITFEEINDDALSRCVKAFNVDSVIEAFSEPTADSGEESGRIEEVEAVQKVIPEPAVSRGFSLDRFKALFRGFSWNYRLSWIAAAATVVIIVGGVVSVVTRTHIGKPDATVAQNDLTLRLPSWTPFDAASFKTWGLATAPLANRIPTFNKGSETLGLGETSRFTPWQLATVLVRSEHEWGSGAVVSSDGWILTNYHVVAGPAQQSAVTGGPAMLDVIAPRAMQGGNEPLPVLKATLYRADPVHDLALIKLIVTAGLPKKTPFFRFAQQVRDGEDCFAVGFETDDGNREEAGWSVHSGNVSEMVDYPRDLNQPAAGSLTRYSPTDREHTRMVVTDMRLSAGDSGGPLLNSKGELIGLTFVSPANRQSNSTTWHIALSELRNFIANLPAEPEGVPFDVWTGGLPKSEILEPELSDLGREGRVDALIYRYASPINKDRTLSPQESLGATTFIDLSERATPGSKGDLVPYGLWGMENQGGFHFDVFVTLRADRVAVVGYTNRQGIVDAIRVGTSPNNAELIWSRDLNGKWQASRAADTPLIDETRFGGSEAERLKLMLNRLPIEIVGSQPTK